MDPHDDRSPLRCPYRVVGTSSAGSFGQSFEMRAMQRIWFLIAVCTGLGHGTASLEDSRSFLRSNDDPSAIKDGGDGVIRVNLDLQRHFREVDKEVDERTKKRTELKRLYDPSKPRINLETLNFSAPYVPAEIRTKFTWEEQMMFDDVKQDPKAYRDKVQRIADENIILPISSEEQKLRAFPLSRNDSCVPFQNCTTMCDHYFMNHRGLSWIIDRLSPTEIGAMKKSKCYLGCCFRSDDTYVTCAKKCWRWFLVDTDRKFAKRFFFQCKRGCDYKCHHHYNAIPSKDENAFCKAYSVKDFATNLGVNEWEGDNDGAIVRGVEAPLLLRKSKDTDAPKKATKEGSQGKQERLPGSDQLWKKFSLLAKEHDLEYLLIKNDKLARRAKEAREEAKAIAAENQKRDKKADGG